MRYVVARCHEIGRDRAYRIYVTDTLQALVNMLAGKQVITERYCEIAYNDTPPKPQKTAAQVKAEILEAFAKLEVRQ